MTVLIPRWRHTLLSASALHLRRVIVWLDLFAWDLDPAVCTNPILHESLLPPHFRGDDWMGIRHSHHMHAAVILDQWALSSNALSTFLVEVARMWPRLLNATGLEWTDVVGTYCHHCFIDSYLQLLVGYRTAACHRTTSCSKAIANERRCEASYCQGLLSFTPIFTFITDRLP